MRVDLLVGRLVLALVLSLDVSHRLRESVGACKRAEGKGKKGGLKRSRNPTSVGRLQAPRCRDTGSSYGAAAARSPHLHPGDGH